MVTEPATYAVKVRRQGDRRWLFLTGSGGMTRLRIHACIYDHDRAIELVTHLPVDNPGVEAKVVPFL